MKCFQCETNGLKSKIYIGMSSSTCMSVYAYYDEDRNYHSHNGNIYTTAYSCSNLHQWKLILPKLKCPFISCGWNSL
jgi:hypothetical protein